jgi:hypothetical protein
LCQTWFAEESLPSCKSRSILKKVELDDYPELFKGLGCLPGDYHIELNEGATPVVQAPRKVQIPQRENVIEELKKWKDLV